MKMIDNPLWSQIPIVTNQNSRKSLEKYLISLKKRIVSSTALINRQPLPLVKDLLEDYEQSFALISKNEGLFQSCKLFKEIYGIALRYSVNHTFEPLKFRKSDKSGFPKIVRKFKLYLARQC